MKHIIILTLTMIPVSFNSSASISQDNPKMFSIAEEEIVFAEYDTEKWYTQCSVASETFYDIYMSDNTYFYYVRLVRFIQFPHIHFYFDNYIDYVLVNSQ